MFTLFESGETTGDATYKAYVSALYEYNCGYKATTGKFRAACQFKILQSFPNAEVRVHQIRMSS